jgi:hypothetical protein
MDVYHEILANKVSEYSDLYSLKQDIDNYTNNHLQEPHAYTFKYNCTNFKRNITTRLNYISNDIRKHIMSSEEYHNKIKHVHKGIRCGFSRYLFKTQYKQNYSDATIFKDRALSQDVTKHICSFLDERDNLSIKFSSVYQDRKSVETLLNSMTLSSLKNLPGIYDNRHYSSGTDNRKKVVNKILKSNAKKQIIQALLDNLDHLYENFRSSGIPHETIQQELRYTSCNPVEIQEWVYDRICIGDKYSKYFDPYYITKKYMIDCLHVLLAIYIHCNHNKLKKKEKVSAKKKTTKKTKKND